MLNSACLALALRNPTPKMITLSPVGIGARLFGIEAPPPKFL